MTASAHRDSKSLNRTEKGSGYNEFRCLMVIHPPSPRPPFLGDDTPVRRRSDNESGLIAGNGNRLQREQIDIRFTIAKSNGAPRIDCSYRSTYISDPFNKTTLTARTRLPPRRFTTPGFICTGLFVLFPFLPSGKRFLVVK